MSVLSLSRWFCSMVTKPELREAVEIFLEALDDKRDDIEFKKNFREEHPNYRKFTVDDVAPLLEPPDLKPIEPPKDWRELISHHLIDTGKELTPVRRKGGSNCPPAECTCEHCGAPADYLSINDGKKKSQVRCKVCKGLSPVRRIRRESQGTYWCPHCGWALYSWKHNDDRTIFKCPNDNCPHYLSNTEALNDKERELSATGIGSQFKRHYQWREYHYDPASITPTPPQGELLKIRSSMHTLGLVLAYAVSYGLSSRMTARILKEVHGILVSHQTVLNWIEKAAPVAWNATEKLAAENSVDDQVAADETYIKIRGIWHYTWFIIGVTTKAIWGWNVTDNRGEKSAVAVLNQTMNIRNKLNTADEELPPLELVGDGNPSYDAATNALNVDENNLPLKPEKRKIIRHTVIGLKDTDEESKLYRPFKQLIERLNRTYRFHTRSRSGFKELNSAQALTTLFVAYYNFLRPHKAFGYKPPIVLEQFRGIETIQGRWLKLLELAG